MNPPTLTPEIQADLRRHNPFARPPVVKGQNIWGESFADVTSLNAHASEAVFATLEQLAGATSSLEKISSLVITAERGVGKSHLIRRIRQRLQTNGEAVFVYASGDEYGDLDLINSGVLRSLASSLERPWSEGVSQWQTVAAAMVARALRSSNPKTKVLSPINLVNDFDQMVENNLSKGKDLIREFARSLSKLHPGSDVYILRAILWTLSEERGWLAVKWLAGEALETQDAADLRLPPNQKTEREREADALSTLIKVLSLISEYQQVIICFDELDTIGCNSLGYPTAIVINDLVKKLFGCLELSKNSQGVCLLTLILPDRWQIVSGDKEVSKAKVLSGADKPITLEYVNTDVLIELASLWLGSFYRTRGFTPPTPIYPFTMEDLTNLGRLKLQVREALEQCSKLLLAKLNTIDPPPTELFQIADAEAQEQFLPRYMEDNDMVASVLRFCFDLIPQIAKLNGTAIEDVVITGTEDIKPKSKNNGYLHFKILATVAGQPVKIAVAVVQQTGGFSVGAAFKRLLDYETFDCDRSCVLRDETRKLKSNWNAYGYYEELVNKGGEWVNLQAEHLKPLFALKYIYDNHEQFHLSHRRLDSFAEVRRRLSQNPLIRDILSQPKGQVLETALEGKTLHHFYSKAEAQQIVDSLGTPDDLMAQDDNQEGITQLDLTALGVA
jgi:hypothetical protein